MSEIERLLIQQREAAYIIHRALDNFKKVGKANYTVANVRNRMTKLDGAFSDCQTIHQKIVAASTPDQFQVLEYFTKEQFLSLHEVYVSTSDFMAEVLATLEGKASQEAATGSAEGNSSGPSTYTSDRLPQLHLPTFTGVLDEWESFRDRFKAMIVSNKDLPEVSKLQYLLSSLNGEPLNVIRNLAITNSNFGVAWDLLIKRYENKRRLITVHVQSLLDLPIATSESKEALCHIRDRANMAIHALKGLDCPVDSWDEILVCLIVNRLDKQSRRAWEMHLGNSIDFPRYSTLDDFLETRIHSLEALIPITKSCSTEKKGELSSKLTQRRTIISHATISNSAACPLCKTEHILSQCPIFREKSVAERFNYVKQGSRCINCLGLRHNLQKCPSVHSCKKCRKRHHTLLHFGEAPTATANAELTTSTAQEITNKVSSLSISRATTLSAHILLATAWVNVQSCSARTQRVRALLDQGSVVSLITENLAQRLRTPRSRVSVSISGVGDNETSCKNLTSIHITSCKRTGPAYSVNALIVSFLSNYSPHRTTHNLQLPYLHGLDLADETPFSSDPIEMIIGADLYGLVLLEGVRKGASHEPVAQNTTLGWILSGPVPSPAVPAHVNLHTHHCITSESLDFELRRFWEVEEVPTRQLLSPAEQRCEEHFVNTHSRLATGQYCVRLPFKKEPPVDIGSSFPIAKSLWSRQECRLQTKKELEREYSHFMKEYEALGHMTEIRDPEPIPSHAVYIPHHAVIRDSSTTTRLRVVFNASCKTSNGTSLNDHLMIGPKLQTELPAVILHWRLHRYVYMADIEKMYRQILVDPRDLDYQRIVWRESPSSSLRHFRLRTVTYGTGPAPYLALRVLRQLAADEGSHYPLALPVLQSQIYVDDCVFGSDDKTLARQTRDQLIALLSRAGFKLRKWSSNSPDLVSDLDDQDLSSAHKTLQQEDYIKVLGIKWNPDTDSFHYDISIDAQTPKTKRAILSTIARLFDPIGWVTPVIIVAKIWMQRLWKLKCDWDDHIPAEILMEWIAYYKQLPCLQRVSLPRWIGNGPDVIKCELHGFADASTSAYAAVVYLRLETNSRQIIVSLLTAKSKVAPVKTISVPRLELCAATLLSRLVNFACSSLNLHHATLHCWTDSTIALAWITQHPSRWKTFVANRVTEIQSNLPSATWHHVPTEDNPADCASRGLSSSDLIKKTLWWNGPLWLKCASSAWPTETPSIPPEATLENRRSVTSLNISAKESWDLANRYSSWTKLIRITAYLFRFLSYLRRTSANRSITPHTSQLPNETSRPSRALSATEIEKARIFWLKYIQNSIFASELQCFRMKKALPRKSPLSSFNAYMDNNELIRVGGRLQNSTMPEAAKHPIVLASHPLVNVLISSIHLRALHAGPQLTLEILRQEFWLLRARPIIRNVLFRCVVCARERATTLSELMGNLPAARVVRAERAFLHTGIDYAGPVLVRTMKGRGHKSHKAYIAIFVCLTTRAIHLELVSDYSTAAFLACLDRFCARRGLPTTIYSDNGTTFQGAEKELRQAFKAATRNPDTLNKLATDRISWMFIPPSAPHFGGLWEAGVRSIKYHLKRVIGAHTLTYEEFTTVLCQVEACLNSRPIAPTSDSIDDYFALTPGHFLIGSAITAVPAPTCLDIRESRLSRWQLLHQMFESFWRAWSNDYLHTLQQRPKWRHVNNLATPGRIVLLKNPQAPPCKWELGRIVKCYPGADNVVRVVIVKTAKSEYKRPVNKLCFLPIDINKQEF